jgi:sarcosine oxidase/L-pipecolate oxidase
LKINNLQTEFVHHITTRSGNKITIPPRIDQADVPQQMSKESAEVMRKAMPNFTATHIPSRWCMCFDAVTPTEDWLLCRHPHPSLRNVIMATGGSFHSYKFLPVAGKYVAKVLKGESCGDEKDRAWKWKSEDERSAGGGLEFGKSAKSRGRARRELVLDKGLKEKL